MMKQFLLVSLFLYTMVNLGADINKGQHSHTSLTSKTLFCFSPYQPFYTRSSTGEIIPVAEIQKGIEDRSDKEIILFLAQLHLNGHRK